MALALTPDLKLEELKGTSGGSDNLETEMHSIQEHSNSSSRYLSIGGVSLRIAAVDRSPIAVYAPHELFVSNSGSTDINIEVQWLSCISPSAQRALFDSGSTWRVFECGQDFRFDFGYALEDHPPAKTLFVDRTYQSATLQLNLLFLSNLGDRIPPLAYPIDELIITHRLTQEKAIELHGCGIVSEDGAGNLFVGHSGAGKSTTTRLWNSCRDVEILSDDRIIVRWDSSTTKREDESVVETPFGAPGAAAGQGILRLRDCSASRNSRFAQDDSTTITSQDYTTQGHMRMYGTPWHGEAMFASPNSAPLTRIVVLEHGHGNVLTPLSRSQAVAELFARSFVPMYRHEYVESALEFLQQVAESVPCYRYSFEPDASAVKTILNLHD